MSPKLNELKHCTLEEAVGEKVLKDVDLLQFRSPTPKWRHPIAGYINIVGRSPYSHSAMFTWNGPNRDEPTTLEVREWHGGRVKSLEWQVEQNDGMIDVYRPCTVLQMPNGTLARLQPDRAVEEMKKFAKRGEYGYRGILAAFMRHAPLSRFFMPTEVDDSLDKGWPPFCSQAYATALRLSFTDLMPNAPDYLVYPGDLTRNPLIGHNYICTLVL
jgi:hypothetical protein